MSSTPIAELLVGVIVRAHGLRGEVVVDVRTDYPDQRFAAGSVLTARHPTRSPGALTVEAARPHGGRLLVSFIGCADRDAAEALRGTMLLVDAGRLPAGDGPGDDSDDDEFHDTQLEGLAVVLDDGTPVGTVRSVAHPPGNDLLVVAREGRPDALVPFVREIVPTVDLAAATITLTPPDGLLD
jgi:16S rRNA processing protein RimM